MDEQLMKEAGFGGGFTSYRNLTVDNGSDIAGKDATGDFVEVSFDENDNRVKKAFSNEFEGVILLPRAVLTFRDKTQTKKKIAESEEFNPILNKERDGAKALIPIYKLDFQGKRQKTPDGQFVVEYAFYNDLKERKAAGEKNMDFAYTIVLYILVDKEIVKLRFKGASRGNFFKLQSSLWKEFKVKAPEVYVKFATYVDEEYKKYAVSFKPMVEADGQPKRYNDMTEIENNIGDLLTSARDKNARMITPSNKSVFRINNGDIDLNPQPVVEDSTSTLDIVEVGTGESTTNVNAEDQELPPIEAYEAQEEPDNSEVKPSDFQ